MRGRVRRGKGGGCNRAAGLDRRLYGRTDGVTVAGWREMWGPHAAQNRLNLTSARLWRTISPYPSLLARFHSEAARARRADFTSGYVYPSGYTQDTSGYVS
jgi:hypothetical protein